jgi:hypothetical protein
MAAVTAATCMHVCHRTATYSLKKGAAPIKVVVGMLTDALEEVRVGDGFARKSGFVNAAVVVGHDATGRWPLLALTWAKGYPMDKKAAEGLVIVKERLHGLPASRPGSLDQHTA